LIQSLFVFIHYTVLQIYCIDLRKFHFSYIVKQLKLRLVTISTIILAYMSWLPGRPQREAEGAWIFLHGTDKVENDLMVLFFGLVFPCPLPPHPLKIFLPTPLVTAWFISNPKENRIYSSDNCWSVGIKSFPAR